MKSYKDWWTDNWICNSTYCVSHVRYSLMEVINILFKINSYGPSLFISTSINRDTSLKQYTSYIMCIYVYAFTHTHTHVYVHTYVYIYQRFFIIYQLINWICYWYVCLVLKIDYHIITSYIFCNVLFYQMSLVPHLCYLLSNPSPFPYQILRVGLEERL